MALNAFLVEAIYQTTDKLQDARHHQANNGLDARHCGCRCVSNMIVIDAFHLYQAPPGANSHDRMTNLVNCHLHTGLPSLATMNMNMNFIN